MKVKHLLLESVTSQVREDEAHTKMEKSSSIKDQRQGDEEQLKSCETRKDPYTYSV